MSEPTYAPTETLPGAIRAWAERDPERPFLREVDGQSATYGEFYQAMLRWADAFRSIGITVGENVPAMVDTSITAEAHWLGLGWIRAVRAGVNTALRGAALAYVITNCQARYLLCSRNYLERIAEIADQLEQLELVIVTDSEPHEFPSQFPIRLVSAHDLWTMAQPDSDLEPPERHEIAAISYTSGTTGRSKGVLVPWGRCWPDISWIDLNSEDILYSPYPVSHLSGLLPLAWTAFPGAQVVLRESFKTQHFWPDVRRFGCTAAALIPTMMNWLLDVPEQPDDLDNPLRMVAGAPVVPRIDEFKRRFGVTMRTMYGTTEVGMPLFAGPDVSSDPDSSAMSVTPGFETRIVDQNDYEVPPGEVGELLVRSTHPWRLMAGYFGMPDKTAEVWRNGWFHTGDGFERDKDGRYRFVDRITDSMRRRGENISSLEVEAFVNEHPAVSESAAIGIPSEYGEDDVKVCVVLHPGETLSPRDLHAFLVDRMPAFMVPRFIEFLVDPERTDAMKRIKKESLRIDPRNDRTWDALSQ